jgi:nucleoside-diphosphate-sugar epimerase
LKRKIGILGCGWLGEPLGKNLIDLGNHVNGSTRSIERISQLKRSGILPFKIDISALSNNINSFFDIEVLIITITSKSIDDFQNLIKVVEKSTVQHVLYISSTSVYDNSNSIVTENDSTNDSNLAIIERLFIKNKNFKTTIIRFGGLFGYLRKPGNFVKPPRVLKNPEGYINLIHQDDCIGILSQIISKNVWGEIFNVCSSSHPKRKEFYQKEVFKLHGLKPEIEQNSLNNYKIISNEKLLKRLSYKFKYNDLLNL